MIIDCHGHYTTAPPALGAWRDQQIAGILNPNFHATGSHYLNADTTAFMQLLQADLFTDFPDLRLVIPHGGGAVPYHWGRFRGLADMLGRPPLDDAVMGNVFFDTCVYHQPGINLLFDVIDVDNILFGSEMVGAVRGIDPQTGHYFDDTRRYVDALDLASSDRAKVFELNARRVYPRLDTALKARNRRPVVGSPAPEANVPPPSTLMQPTTSACSSSATPPTPTRSSPGWSSCTRRTSSASASFPSHPASRSPTP